MVRCFLCLYCNVSFVYGAAFPLSIIFSLSIEFPLCITFGLITSLVLVLLCTSGMGVAKMSRCWDKLFFLYSLVVRLFLFTIEH